MLPLVTKTKKQHKDTTIYFLGYNGTENLKAGDLPGMLNLCSDEFPCLSPRQPRELITTLTDPQALFAANGKLVYVDGTDFKYDGTTKGQVTAGRKCMVDFQNTTILIFPDKKYYNYSTDTFGNIGNGETYPAEGSCPDIDYAVALNNRVWACKDNHIYACKLGDFQDWTTLGTSAGDAWAVDVASEGSFIGIAKYMNHVQFFKQDIMHEQYGDKTSNFQIKEVLRKGTLSHDSIQEVSGMLLSLWRDGINAYLGGQPVPISVDLGKNYVSAAAGANKQKYYISLYDGSGYDLFVYDSLNKVWHREDALNVIQFATLDGYIYALCSDGKLYKFNSGNEMVSWEAILQIAHEYYLGKKGYSHVSFRADLHPGTIINVFVKVDNRDFKLVKTYDSQGLTSVTVPLRIERADHFQIKITGKGKAKIHQIERKFYFGSDRP